MIQLFVALIGLAAIGEAIRRHPTAREVVWTGLTNLFGFFTTPFVLEVTLAVGGLLAVLTFNEWRRQQEGDEWVSLPADPPSPATEAETELPARQDTATPPGNTPS